MKPVLRRAKAPGPLTRHAPRAGGAKFAHPAWTNLFSRLPLLNRSSGVSTTSRAWGLRFIFSGNLLRAGMREKSFLNQRLRKRCSRISSFWQVEAHFPRIILLQMFMWAQFIAAAFSSFYIHIAYRKGLISKMVVRILQHSSQTFVIAYAVVACLYNDWAIIPSTFILMISSIYFMKMHSFVESNLEWLEAEKKATEERNPDYPANLTLGNYAHYMICPVLVYETSYPKSDHSFRWRYFLQKVFFLTTAIVLLYVVATTAIIPVSEQSLTMPLLIVIVKLAIPMLVADMLVFFLLFECICNGLAELANYGDREFYEDWWNSTTFDEYARKWNRPVHEFLLRHVYLDSINRYSLSKRDASVAVFVFSGLLHELILSVAFRTIRFYLFALMMLQIPLIQLSRYYKTAGWKFGNVLFWVGMSLGVPFLTACYAREWAAQQPVEHPRHLVLV
eukprot:Polyplicarium_translucidae@DN2966_c0_g1_i1.p2